MKMEKTEHARGDGTEYNAGHLHKPGAWQHPELGVLYGQYAPLVATQVATQSQPPDVPKQMRSPSAFRDCSADIAA
jgi:hypothetical protein